MAVLHDLLGALLPGGSTSRRARRVIEQGERVTARVDAIRVKDRSDSPDRWEYGLAIGGERVGVRQWLEPERHRAHLGAEVVVRRLGDRVLIDWPGTLAAAGVDAQGADHHSAGDWKTLGDPPPPGIADSRLNGAAKKIARGRRATAVLGAAEHDGGWSGLSSKWRLTLGVDGVDIVVTDAVPAYALHLLEPGRSLPVAWSGERLIVDWKAAAEEAVA